MRLIIIAKPIPIWVRHNAKLAGNGSDSSLESFLLEINV